MDNSGGLVASMNLTDNKNKKTFDLIIIRSCLKFALFYIRSVGYN